MNKIYRIIWSKSKKCYVVVSEIAKRSGKSSSGLARKLLVASVLAGALVGSGMGTVYAENVLGMKYREKHGEGYVGGPMYYIGEGLRCKWGAAVFALFCTLSAFGMGNMTQANSISGALETGFGISPVLCGILMTAVIGLIVFGGIDRIASLRNTEYEEIERATYENAAALFGVRADG